MNDTLDNFNQTDFESNLDENFNMALELSEGEFGYDELIAFLASDKIAQRQIAALRLNEIKSPKDAKILASNLVGQDGKIREAVAYKLNKLMKNREYSAFFRDENVYGTLLEGIMDINGNVCRQIVDLSNVSGFCEYLCEKLPPKIELVLEEIVRIESETRQYVISKRNFQLYWCLEALCNIIESIDLSKVIDILEKTGGFYDYTIREKTAKIVSKLDNSEFSELKNKLKNDENYYVRRYLT